MNFGKVIKKQNGSMTVEAAIVFPIIILTIFAIMYICMLMYQHAYVQAIGDMTVKRAAVTWKNSRKNVDTGYVNKKQFGETGLFGLYNDIVSVNTKKKKKNLEEYIKVKLSNYDVLKCTSEDIEIDYDNYIIYKKLNVKISQRYKIPLGEMLKIFGLDKYYTIKVQSNAVINDPKAVIDNIDFILEVVNETKAGEQFMSKWNDMITKMGDKINDFFSE